jgi:DNA alkylation damage repair protein AlkB
MLHRKLRWITLGGQYDWTAKIYPDGPPPPFPEDIGQLVKAISEDINPEAAILNFYSPGDTLSLHRDVSEECDRTLISINLGCDGLFLIANQEGSAYSTIRLKSGDIVLMSGESRFAWHAVPKILPDTCPKYLEMWPASESNSEFEHWRDWMKSKRINLNIRQMKPGRSEP